MDKANIISVLSELLTMDGDLSKSLFHRSPSGFKTMFI